MATPASPTALTLPELLRVTQTAASETNKATSITEEDGRGARIRTWDRTDISRLL